MYCHHCGEPLPESSRFCPQCGKEVQNKKETTSEKAEKDTISTINRKTQITASDNYTDGQEEELGERTIESEISFIDENEREESQKIDSVSNERETHSELSRKNRSNEPKRTWAPIIPILVPIISFLLVAAGLVLYFSKEMDKNEEVLALQKTAENMALEGDFENARLKLMQAENIRPNYKVIKDSRIAIERALDYEIDLQEINLELENQNYSGAEEKLAAFKTNLSQEIDPLFDRFKEAINNNETLITVGKIKQELKQLSDIADLAEKLNVVRRIPNGNEQTEEVKSQLITRIVEITSSQAEEQLKDKQFSEALFTVNYGLEYATDSEKLHSLKDKIENEQTEFEKAEQERLERALEEAEKEDLLNETAAVNVDAFEVWIDEYGDLNIQGDVSSAATRPIYDIIISYSVYDLEGNYLYEDSTNVYPYYLNPGEQGSFEDVIYYVVEDVEVVIENITWYIE